jgi:NtrC-family two-component system response regulator AlgB
MLSWDVLQDGQDGAVATSDESPAFNNFPGRSGIKYALAPEDALGVPRFWSHRRLFLMISTEVHRGKLRILIVDDEQTIRTTLGICLEADGHEVQSAANSTDAISVAARTAFDLIFLDLRLGTESGLDLIPLLLAQNPWVQIVVITAYASVDTAVDAMKRGAADYLPKPFTPAQVEMVTTKVARQRQLELKIEALQQAMGADDVESDFATSEPAFRAAVQLGQRVAPSNATVLIRGEVGSGRDRLARAIHLWSGRSNGPFAAVSCHGQADELEAELFGAARYSTAATAQDASHGGTAAPDQRGRAAFAAGGTLLLKEVTEAPISLQPKIVRLLRDHEYERQGEFAPRTSDVRVIATSSTELDSAVASGAIRPDLAQALDIVAIDIPPLRERRRDIPMLAERYLAFFAREHGRPVTQFSADSMDALKRHSYPGNSRELRNLVERAVLISRGTEIMLENLPANLLNADAARVGDLVPLEQITDLHIRQVLASTRSYESAAAVLGINSITLWRKRKRYRI